MRRSDAKRGTATAPGGALADGLRRLQQLHRAGALSNEEAVRARERLMAAVVEAEILAETPPPAAGRAGRGGILTLAAVAAGAVAMLGATPDLLVCLCLAALATVGFAACWDA